MAAGPLFHAVAWRPLGLPMAVTVFSMNNSRARVVDPQGKAIAVARADCIGRYATLAEAQTAAKAARAAYHGHQSAMISARLSVERAINARSADMQNILASQFPDTAA